MTKRKLRSPRPPRESAVRLGLIPRPSPYIVCTCMYLATVGLACRPCRLAGYYTNSDLPESAAEEPR